MAMYRCLQADKTDKICIADWDFKTSLTDSIFGYTVTLNSYVTNNENGLVFTDKRGKASLPLNLLNYDCLYEIKLGEMDAQFSNSKHGTVFAYETFNDSNAGLIFHYQTQKWGVWDYDHKWTDSEVSDKNYFSNSTVYF